jgi:acetolactate synthase-1/2/3 large subunit
MPMAIGAAIGASETASGRKTFCLAGDGGFILNLGELACMVQERADMVIVLMNDKSYGVIKNIQDAQYGGRRCYAELHTPDYELLCKSLALPHARVKKLDDLPGQLAKAVATQGPFLLEIDMLSIGGFKATFAGPPTNTVTQIPALGAAAVAGK